ncbi:hypothetical protein LX32DRAFT_731418 [Colletotrichum zoysiae]|uniref:BTB domain-containing protein n=1 Tax=Colletotrichum zoysiae TaxID=1216348 RepID=A0AAD9LX91_9PEZI|nr:hypothetical protein LX32DRAFT_731418 [Colletotrichum zoysiae]
MAMATGCLDDFAEVLSSRVITFIVGPEKKAFHVNETLVTSRSEVFRKMLTNGMRESKEGVVELDDLDPCIFTSFIQYALCGNYNVPKPEDGTKVELLDKKARVRFNNLQESVLDRRPLDKPETNLEYLNHFMRQGDMGMSYARPPGLPASVGPEAPDMKAKPDSPVSWSRWTVACAHHMRMYVFADRYDAGELRQLCLHRLHRSLVFRLFLSLSLAKPLSLSLAKPNETGYRYLFEAVAFGFENTCPGDKIRKLLVQACVADLPQVRPMTGFKELCGRIPELSYEMIMEAPISRPPSTINTEAKTQAYEHYGCRQPDRDYTLGLRGWI